MKKLLFLIFPLIVLQGFSQQKPAEFKPQNLEIKWEIIRNNDQGKAQTLSALTIINHDQNSLPASGWKLFFNFERMIHSVSGPVKSSYFNGDLFCLSPEKDFKTLKSGESFRTEIISADWVINKTDAPAGFYWIDDARPNQQIPISNIVLIPSTKPAQLMRDPTDLVPASTPEMVFSQNKNIVNIAAESLPPIFPTPVSYQYKTGKFLLDGNVTIQADAVFSTEKLVLQQLLTVVFGSEKRQISTQKIILSVNKTLTPEAYELKINPTQITISAADGAGIFYGIQSLKSLFSAEVWVKKQMQISLPNIEVKDAPRFGYRGLLIDVARNFQPKTEILKVLELMASYKLNTLHLHLNDDEGWRLEIASLPELTSVGSKRGHTLDAKEHLPPSYGSGPDVNNPYGSGFYTKADFIEILKFAKARHITVIPEMETPGHARAAIKSMDARYRMLLLSGKKQEAERFMLHDLGDHSVYRSVQNWNDNVMDVSLPSTYNFLETVADEVIAIYKEADAPLKTIHFGGDEVPAGVWEKSPAYLKLRATHPEIKSTDDLWYYYFGKVNQILKKRNLYVSGWEEAGLRKTVLNGQKTNIPNPDFADQNFHLYVWNNVIGGGAEDLAYKMANAGYPVVLGNVTNLYFDMAYQKAFDEPGYYWGSYVDVEKPFRFIPYNYFKNSNETAFGKPVNADFYAAKEALTAKGKANILGIQGLLWAETVKGIARLEYMLAPKILGLAERAWSKDPEWATEPDLAKSKVLYDRAWSVFTNGLGRKELPKLSYLAGGFNYRIPTAGVLVENGQVKANVQFPGMLIRYTTDGSEPNANSAVYTKPITNKGTLKFSVFNSAGRGSRSVSVLNP